jgi:glycosyltransferase involved in cell wall biosynthesis
MITRCILHVIDHFGAGGAQQLLADIASRQVLRGAMPMIVCLRGRTPLSATVERLGVPIHYIGRSRTDPRQAVELWALIRALNPDVVHTHLTVAGLLARACALAAQVPVVVHDHEANGEIFTTPAPLLALKRLIEPRAGPRALRYVMISRSALRYAREVRRLPAAQLALVPNGIDLAYLEAGRESARQARVRLGVGEGGPVIGFAGRLAPQKGLETLLDALARLPEARLLVAGSGPLEAEARAIVTVRGLSKRVRFLGFLNDVRPLYCACDVYVQPSRREAFGLAAAEAAALGAPVIASDVGGLRDVVVAGVSGILVAPDAPVALATALATLLADPSRARQMGDAGRQHIRANFAIERVLEQLDALYDELLGKASGFGDALPSSHSGGAL